MLIYSGLHMPCMFMHIPQWHVGSTKSSSRRLLWLITDRDVLGRPSSFSNGETALENAAQLAAPHPPQSGELVANWSPKWRRECRKERECIYDQTGKHFRTEAYGFSNLRKHAKIQGGSFPLRYAVCMIELLRGPNALPASNSRDLEHGAIAWVPHTTHKTWPTRRNPVQIRSQCGTTEHRRSAYDSWRLRLQDR